MTTFQVGNLLLLCVFFLGCKIQAPRTKLT